MRAKLAAMLVKATEPELIDEIFNLMESYAGDDANEDPNELEADAEILAQLKNNDGRI